MSSSCLRSFPVECWIRRELHFEAGGHFSKWHSYSAVPSGLEALDFVHSCIAASYKLWTCGGWMFPM